MEKIIRAIRGATTADVNEEEAISFATRELLEEMMNANELDEEDLVSILFTATSDLNAAFPAKAAREIGLTDTPLMCSSEISVPNSLEKCVRILMHVCMDARKRKSDVIHVYMREAAKLREDLFGRNKA